LSDGSNPLLKSALTEDTPTRDNGASWPARQWIADGLFLKNPDETPRGPAVYVAKILGGVKRADLTVCVPQSVEFL
jgi:hypothetical protein